VPAEELIWQDPVPAVDHELIDDADIAALKATILDSGLTVSELVSTAWASASTYRDSDKRGGANGARIRLAPQNDWEVNNPPASAAPRCSPCSRDPGEFNAKGGGKVSLADLIVLGGARRRGRGQGRRPRRRGAVHARSHRRHPGADRRRVVRPLEPKADGFRNYLGKGLPHRRPSTCWSTRRSCSDLTAPEMTVLVGGLRVLGANTGGSRTACSPTARATLTNDFFVNLLDMGTVWRRRREAEDVFEGRDRATGDLKWTGTRVDLVFGSNSQLRAIAEVYGATTPARSSSTTSCQRRGPR
jgi:catalase-peroxidase